MTVEVMRFVVCPTCGAPVVDPRIQVSLTQTTPVTCWNCQATVLVKGEKYVKTGPLSYEEATSRWSR